ncbi:PIG-L deacetylase family protein [Bartonella sp. LJL80]
MVTAFSQGTLMRAPTTQGRLEDIAPGGRILVLAPHPDDEALGCGGAIAAANDAGMEIHIVCVTDGRLSHQNSQKWPPEKLINLRATEFYRSSALLTGGKGNAYMLGYTDQSSPQTAADIELACLRVKAMLSPFRPSVIWSSWIGDPHIDHQNAARLAYALQRHWDEAALYFYSVWGRFVENDQIKNTTPLSFDTTKFQSIKSRAVMAHQSQMTQLIDDDPSGFVMTAQTRDHLVQTNEFFLEADDEYRSL